MAEFGKIICISAGFIKGNKEEKQLRIKSFFSHNEEELLTKFNDLLNTHYNTDRHLLCALNGKEFDFPYLARRMAISEIIVPPIPEHVVPVVSEVIVPF